MDHDASTRFLGLLITILLCTMIGTALSCESRPIIYGMEKGMVACTAQPDLTDTDFEAVLGTSELLQHETRTIENGTTILTIPGWQFDGGIANQTRLLDPLCQENMTAVSRSVEQWQRTAQSHELYYVVPDYRDILATVPRNDDPRHCRYQEPVPLGELYGITDEYETRPYCYETENSLGCPSYEIDSRAFLTTMAEQDNYGQITEYLWDQYWTLFVVILGTLGSIIVLGLQRFDPRQIDHRTGLIIFGGYLGLTIAMTILANLNQPTVWSPSVLLVDNWIIEASLIAYVVAAVRGTDQQQE